MQVGRRAQVWRHQPAYHRPRHFHAEPEINLVIAGHAKLGVGSTTRLLRGGEACVFFPGQDHELLEASPDLQLFVLALTPELWQRITEARLRSPSGSARLSPEESHRAVELFGAMAEVSDASVVERALGEIFVDVAAKQTPLDQSAVSRRAVELLQVSPDVSGVELAARLRVDPAELSRRVQRALGVRFVEYRSRLRVLELVRAVEAGQSLSQAAISAGFGSYAQCHRVCAAAFGCSPRDFFGANPQG